MDLNPIGWGAVGFSFSSAAWVVRGVKFQGWAGRIHFSLTLGALEKYWIMLNCTAKLFAFTHAAWTTCKHVPPCPKSFNGRWIGPRCGIYPFKQATWWLNICSVCTEGMFSSLLAGRQAILLFSFGCCFCLPIFHVLRRDAKVYQAGGRVWMQRLIRSCLQKGCDGKWIILAGSACSISVRAQGCWLEGPNDT